MSSATATKVRKSGVSKARKAVATAKVRKATPSADSKVKTAAKRSAAIVTNGYNPALAMSNGYSPVLAMSNGHNPALLATKVKPAKPVVSLAETIKQYWEKERQPWIKLITGMLANKEELMQSAAQAIEEFYRHPLAKKTCRAIFMEVEDCVVRFVVQIDKKAYKNEAIYNMLDKEGKRLSKDTYLCEVDFYVDDCEDVPRHSLSPDSHGDCIRIF